MGVVHREGDFGAARCVHDIACAPDDQREVTFLDHRDQSDVIDEIDVGEVLDFARAELLLRREEPAIDRFIAHSMHG